MEVRSEVIEIIFSALRSLNEELPEDRRVPIAEDSLLFGTGGSLDSLSLVSVVIDVESSVCDKFNRSISLTDDAAMDQEISPFASVAAMTNYIVIQLAQD